MDLCLLLFHYQIFQEGRSKSNWQVFFSLCKCQVHISEGEGKAWWASTLTERLTERGRFTEEAVHVIHELHLQADNFSSQQPLALIYVSLLYVWVSTYFHRGDLKDVCYNYWKLFILEYAEIAAPRLILWFMLISVYLKHMILNHSSIEDIFSSISYADHCIQALLNSSHIIYIWLGTGTCIDQKTMYSSSFCLSFEMILGSLLCWEACFKYLGRNYSAIIIFIHNIICIPWSLWCRVYQGLCEEKKNPQHPKSIITCGNGCEVCFCMDSKPHFVVVKKRHFWSCLTT